MSLTSLLENDPKIKELFKKIPNLKPHMKSLIKDVEPFPKKFMPISPPIQGGNSGNVGSAFDIYFRAKLQFLAKKEVETEVSDVVMGGLIWLKEDKVITSKEEKLLKEEIFSAWQLRSDFINGIDVNEDELLKRTLLLTYLQNYYRARGFEREEGYFSYNQSEFEDLKQLVNNTSVTDLYFVSKKELICNPTFAENSQLVGGADADFILDGTLFDIKCTKNFGYSANYIRQLLGYYLLAKTCSVDLPEIKELGIYFPRFNHSLTISIETIRSFIDLDKFEDDFFNILYKL